jgi:hypothetical protein
MPKGEKLRPEQLDQLPLVYFSKLLCKNTWSLIKTLLLQKRSLVGGDSIMGKGGVFGI